MKQKGNRQAPGRVRDAIFQVMSLAPYGLSARQIADRIRSDLGLVPESSIRSYLSLNTPNTFIRESRGVYRLGASHGAESQRPLFEAAKEKPFSFGRTVLFHDNAFDWLAGRLRESIHAVATPALYDSDRCPEKNLARVFLFLGTTSGDHINPGGQRGRRFQLDPFRRCLGSSGRCGTGKAGRNRTVGDDHAPWRPAQGRVS